MYVIYQTQKSGLKTSNKVSVRRHYHNTIVERRQRQQNNFQREIKQFKPTAVHVEKKGTANSAKKQKMWAASNVPSACQTDESGLTAFVKSVAGLEALRRFSPKRRRVAIQCNFLRNFESFLIWFGHATFLKYSFVAF